MTPNSNPNDDPRTTAELVSVALTETDEEIAWDTVRALHWRGGLDVLERAKQLAESICSGERRLGADILGQLGVPERRASDCGSQTRIGIRLYWVPCYGSRRNDRIQRALSSVGRFARMVGY